VLQLAREQSRATGRTIGVIPETKHPSYFDSIGLSLEEPLLATLDRYGLDSKRDAVAIQSFEVGNLKELHRRTSIRLVQLTSATRQPYDFAVAHDPRTYADVVSAKGLREVATYASFVGPEATQVIPWAADGTLAAPTALVRDAHAAGLKVTPYTFGPRTSSCRRRSAPAPTRRRTAT
jgi:glycerophosphoryl diester phosphodiesterase